MRVKQYSATDQRMNEYHVHNFKQKMPDLKRVHTLLFHIYYAEKQKNECTMLSQAISFP